MKMYEAAPGTWLPEGVTMEEHRAACAGNWDGGAWDHEYALLAEGPTKLDEDRTWRKRDGSLVAYDDIDDEHLGNIVALLERTGKTGNWPNLMTLHADRRTDVEP